MGEVWRASDQRLNRMVAIKMLPLALAADPGLRARFEQEARAVCRHYIANVVTTWEQTGLTWERCNGVSGGHKVPFERSDPAPLHGFSSAAAVYAGRVLFA